MLSRLLLYVIFPLHVCGFFRSTAVPSNQMAIFRQDAANGEKCLSNMNTVMSSFNCNSSVLAIWYIYQASSKCVSTMEASISHLEVGADSLVIIHGREINSARQSSHGTFKADHSEALTGLAQEWTPLVQTMINQTSEKFAFVLPGSSVFACRKINTFKILASRYYEKLMTIVPVHDLSLHSLLENTNNVLLALINVFLTSYCPTIAGISDRAEL
ncbi:hypothetical protein C8R47DRAFT_1079008 [Mycena vitilis]|nr:hypothetical protein C8R47DRAFT_1079008 [Mycena vitilis]